MTGRLSPAPALTLAKLCRRSKMWTSISSAARRTHRQGFSGFTER